MKKRRIYVTSIDRERLINLLMEADALNEGHREELQALQEELAAAKVVEPADVPDTVVTMNTRLRFMDLDDQTETEVTLVFPPAADVDQGKISVFSPVGTALLGYGKGDTIKWKVPGGIRRIQITEILFQPEAAEHA